LVRSVGVFAWRANRISNLHAPHAAILEAIDVLDHLLPDQLASPVPDDLPHVDYDAAVLGHEAHRCHVRIDRTPLSGPVLADRVVTLDPTTVHAVRPVPVRMRGGMRPVHRAGVARRRVSL